MGAGLTVSVAGQVRLIYKARREMIAPCLYGWRVAGWVEPFNRTPGRMSEWAPARALARHLVRARGEESMILSARGSSRWSSDLVMP
jgi:hypothetical protein